MGRPRKLTDEQLEEIKRLDKKEGLSRIFIAQRFAVDQSLITKILGKKQATQQKKKNETNSGSA